MSMFPHTVTLYNVAVERQPDFSEKSVNHITVLRGVLLDASKAVNVRTSGLEGADAVNLYIPFDVDAVDGVTGETKQYIGPIEYWRMQDKGGYWTLKADNNNFFVKGEAVDPDGTFERIGLQYDDVYTITKVDEKDFGGLQHWEVGGN